MQEKERQMKNKNKLLNTKLKAEKEEVGSMFNIEQVNYICASFLLFPPHGVMYKM